MRSIAIAGAWGYIGRKFIDAGLAMGMRVYALDPGPAPDDVDFDVVAHVLDESEFYAFDVDLFHLALHPEHRSPALRRLLARARGESLLILEEKPMAAPERPQDCDALIDAVSGTRATVLFDFPELFDPLTAFILEFLGDFDRVAIDEIHIERSKDREDPDNPRNAKRMVHIQFQESVHCLAFVLNLLARVRGSLGDVLSGGVSIEASAEPYEPPNPEAYNYVVDGRCEFELALGETRVNGHTDFKRGAAFRKLRVIRGRGDGRSFEIEVDYLEGAKRLAIHGVDQHCDPAGSSYEAVLRTLGQWRGEMDESELMTGVFPNPGFARLTYQLSAALWRSSWEGGRLIAFAGEKDLLEFESGFADAKPQLPHYPL